MFGGKDMNIYTTDKIRNVAILGHGGCGKTSLTEAMARKRLRDRFQFPHLWLH